MNTLKTGAALAAMIIFLGSADVLAQDYGSTGTTTSAVDDRPSLLPLLGLLGLLGLFGLKRRHPDHVERR